MSVCRYRCVGVDVGDDVSVLVCRCRCRCVGVSVSRCRLTPTRQCRLTDRLTAPASVRFCGGLPQLPSHSRLSPGQRSPARSSQASVWPPDRRSAHGLGSRPDPVCGGASQSGNTQTERQAQSTEAGTAHVQCMTGGTLCIHMHWTLQTAPLNTAAVQLRYGTFMQYTGTLIDELN